MRSQVGNSKEPVVIADPEGRILYSNETFQRLPGSPGAQLETLDDLGGLFIEPEDVRDHLRRLLRERLPWRGEAALVTAGREALPLGVRADVVPGAGDSILGFIVILSDLTTASRPSRRAGISRPRCCRPNAISPGAGRHAAAAVRRRDGRDPGQRQCRGDGDRRCCWRRPDRAAAEELEASTQRAAALYRRLRSSTARAEAPRTSRHASEGGGRFIDHRLRLGLGERQCVERRPECGGQRPGARFREAMEGNPDAVAVADDPAQRLAAR